MLSYDRWKPQPARWSVAVLIGGAGFGIATYHWTPAVVGFGLLVFAVIVLLETIVHELRTLTRLARVIFHEDDWPSGEGPDTAFIARLRGERWNSAGKSWERMDNGKQPPPPSWWPWQVWKDTARSAEIERRRALGENPHEALEDLRDLLWGPPPERKEDAREAQQQQTGLSPGSLWSLSGGGAMPTQKEKPDPEPESQEAEAPKREQREILRNRTAGGYAFIHPWELDHVPSTAADRAEADLLAGVRRWDVSDVAAMAGLKVGTIKSYLSRNGDQFSPALYRKDRRGRKIRILTATEAGIVLKALITREGHPARKARIEAALKEIQKPTE